MRQGSILRTSDIKAWFTSADLRHRAQISNVAWRWTELRHGTRFALNLSQQGSQVLMRAEKLQKGFLSSMRPQPSRSMTLSLMACLRVLRKKELLSPEI